MYNFKHELLFTNIQKKGPGIILRLKLRVIDMYNKKKREKRLYKYTNACTIQVGSSVVKFM